MAKNKDSGITAQADLKLTPDEPATEEYTLEDLFKDLWEGGEDEATSGAEENTEETEDVTKFGQFGIPESKYPPDLKLNEYDRQRLEAISHYWESNYKLPKDLAPIHDDELGVVKGKLNMFSADILVSERKIQEQRIAEANEEIKQKKDSGYKGASKQESYQKWQKLNSELAQADDSEKGAILNTAAVGKSGIQYWQKQRKSAERELKRIDFTEKMFKRFMFSQTSA